MKLIFMGTPDFSVSALKALLDAGHEVACVYSQPPRKSGRGQKLSPTPDRKSTRLNSSHITSSYAVFCLKKKNNNTTIP